MPGHAGPATIVRRPLHTNPAVFGSNLHPPPALTCPSVAASGASAPVPLSGRASAHPPHTLPCGLASLTDIASVTLCDDGDF